MKPLILFLTLVLLGVSCKKDEAPTAPPTNNTSPLNPSLTYGVVSDIDGNEYATIQIGSQVWMAENLRTTKYCNGDTIPNLPDENQWGNSLTGAWVHMANDSQYDNTYGKLYNWFAANDSRNICPCGWHLPSVNEWTVLTDYLGGDSIAGGKLKSANTLYWNSPNTDATNETGFSGISGGSRFYSGDFDFFGDAAIFWSSTEDGTGYVWFRYLYYSAAGVYSDFDAKGSGLSVRCVMD